MSTFLRDLRRCSGKKQGSPALGLGGEISRAVNSFEKCKSFHCCCYSCYCSSSSCYYCYYYYSYCCCCFYRQFRPRPRGRFFLYISSLCETHCVPSSLFFLIRALGIYIYIYIHMYTLYIYIYIYTYVCVYIYIYISGGEISRAR